LVLTVLAPTCTSGLALRGWIDLTSGREVHVKKAVKYFDEALKMAKGSCVRPSAPR
jgi:hypothetical protein